MLKASAYLQYDIQPTLATLWTENSKKIPVDVRFVKI